MINLEAIIVYSKLWEKNKLAENEAQFILKNQLRTVLNMQITTIKQSFGFFDEMKYVTKDYF